MGAAETQAAMRGGCHALGGRRAGRSGRGQFRREQQKASRLQGDADSGFVPLIFLFWDTFVCFYGVGM